MFTLQFSDLFYLEFLLSTGMKFMGLPDIIQILNLDSHGKIKERKQLLVNLYQLKNQNLQRQN